MLRDKLKYKRFVKPTIKSVMIKLSVSYRNQLFKNSTLTKEEIFKNLALIARNSKITQTSLMLSLLAGKSVSILRLYSDSELKEVLKNYIGVKYKGLSK